MELKSPLDIEEQLAELNRHHIQIGDPANAHEILTKVSYYRLSGYWLKHKYAGTDTPLSQRLEMMCGGSMTIKPSEGAEPW